MSLASLPLKKVSKSRAFIGKNVGKGLQVNGAANAKIIIFNINNQKQKNAIILGWIFKRLLVDDQVDQVPMPGDPFEDTAEQIWDEKEHVLSNRSNGWLRHHRRAITDSDITVTLSKI